MKRNKRIDMCQGMWVLLLLAIIGFSSCKEISPDGAEGQKALIALNLSTVETDGLRADTETTINNMYVLVFTQNNVREAGMYATGANIATMTVTVGTKNIYAFANISEDIKNKLEAVTHPDQLKEIELKFTDVNRLPAFDMSGVAENFVVNKHNPGDAAQQVNIQMQRSVAQIYIVLRNKTADKTLVVQEVKIKNLIKRVRLYPSERTSSFDALNASIDKGDLTISLSGVATTTLAPNDTLLLPVTYVNENHIGAANNKDWSALLEVTATLGGVPTRYEVYINETVANSSSPEPGTPNSSTVNPSDHLYKLNRNHQYRLFGNIKGLGEVDGLILTTEVLPWNKKDTKVIFSRDYRLYDKAILVEANYAKSEYEIGYADDIDQNEIEFWFLFLNPQGAAWNAKLENASDFEFVTSSPFTMWGSIGLHRIKIRCKTPKSNAVPFESDHYKVLTTKLTIVGGFTDGGSPATIADPRDLVIGTSSSGDTTEIIIKTRRTEVIV